MTKLNRRQRAFVARLALGVSLLLTSARFADAQTAVTLPDTTQMTTLSATVVEQASVTVPGGITFDVNNVSTNTDRPNNSVSVQNIVLTTATKQLRISLFSAAPSFTPPVAGTTTWSVGDVSWNDGPGGGPNAWQNATGSAGTLSSSAYTPVATCDADTTSCSVTGLKFTLAAKSSAKRSGSHTLVVTWKFESI